MGDENPIRALGDYSKPIHEGYKNTMSSSKGIMGCLFDPKLSGESLYEAWTRFNDLIQKVPHHGIDLWIRVQIFYDHVNLVTRRDIDQSAGGKLRDRNVEESWALLEDLALYDNESWNNPRDFAKPVKVISLPQDVPSTSDRRLIELKNQVQCLMEAHVSPKQPVQVNKITSSCEIYNAPHDTQYCMENPKKSFVEYASLRNNKVGDRQVHYKPRTKKFQRDSMTHVNVVSTNLIEKEELQRQGIKSPSKSLSPKYLSQASLKEQNRNPSSPKRVHFINYVVILCKEDKVREEENVKPNATEYNDHEKAAKAEEKDEEESEDEFEEEIKEEEEDDVEYFDTFHSLEDLRYHEWLLKYPKPSWVNAKINRKCE
nr:MAK10-like protein [Tanacetum cinerariifolium]